jgi:hypothetical protein
MNFRIRRQRGRCLGWDLAQQSLTAVTMAVTTDLMRKLLALALLALPLAGGGSRARPFQANEGDARVSRLVRSRSTRSCGC